MVWISFDRIGASFFAGGKALSGHQPKHPVLKGNPMTTQEQEEATLRKEIERLTLTIQKLPDKYV